MLLDLRARGEHPDLGAAGDRASAQSILTALHDERPDDAILIEDAADDAARLAAERVWIIDPLDGTREFADGDRADWAVHIALWKRGEISAAAVGVPARNLVLSSTSARAWNGDRKGRALRMAVSRSRPPDFAEALRAALQAELVPLGSAGYKTASVILGEVDMYVHAGGQYEWDTAAPAGVARAAGLHVSRIDGSALRYNQPSPWLPDLLVCHPADRELALGAISDVRASQGHQAPETVG